MIRVVNVRGLNKAEQRAAVCYCGRRCAGWPESPWHNPFKVGGTVTAEECLRLFRDRVETQPDEWLAALWEACDRGTKPLGCWCTTATHGDGQPVVCHAQILVALLHERFVAPVEPPTTKGA